MYAGRHGRRPHAQAGAPSHFVQLLVYLLHVLIVRYELPHDGAVCEREYLGVLRAGAQGRWHEGLIGDRCGAPASFQPPRLTIVSIWVRPGVVHRLLQLGLQWPGDEGGPLCSDRSPCRAGKRWIQTTAHWAGLVCLSTGGAAGTSWVCELWMAVTRFLE